MTRRPAPLARRLSIVIVSVVILAGVVAALLSVGLVRAAARNQAQSALARQANAAAELINAVGGNEMRTAAAVLRAQDVPSARLLPDGTLAGERLAEAAISSRLPALKSGKSLSFRTAVGGDTVLVEARPLAAGGGVVLARRSTIAVGPALALLQRQLIALLIGVVVAAGAGVLLARWLAAPLGRAAAAARRLAGGERDIRLRPEGPAEVAQVAESINAVAGALQHSEARQREFLLSVTHELRTPLTAVKGFAEALADGVATGDDVPNAAKVILAESARLELLVGDLLDLARLGAQDFRVDYLPVDLTALLADAATVWRARCGELGVLFGIESPAASLNVRTDPARVRQIVDGLAENALRVTPAGARIVFALRTGGGAGPGSAGEAVIEVRDGGPGLTPDDRAVAFERSALYRRYRGVRPVGTGLGLALVHALAERLGGIAEVDQAPEGGACFRIRLPAAPATAPV